MNKTTENRLGGELRSQQTAQRLLEELRRRGVPRKLWEDAVAELPDSGEALDALIQKRRRGDLTDPKERRRICDALLRRGFSWSQVKAAMARYTEMEEDE